MGLASGDKVCDLRYLAAVGDRLLHTLVDFCAQRWFYL